MSHGSDVEDGYLKMDYSNNDPMKRPRTDENDGVSSNKRSKGDTVMLKQLFPSLITGLIIGKGGEAITKLQSDTNTTIKMSKNGDYFPGTSDRICIILGSVDNVKEAHLAVWDKIKKRQEAASEEMKLRVLVPNVTVGMIIGKAGCYVKQIKDDTGATVQVSPKSPNPLLLERIVTITGASEQVMNAFDMVFSKICEDPQSGSCPNISYTDITGSGGLDLSLIGTGVNALIGLGGSTGGVGHGGVTMPGALSSGSNPFAAFNFSEAVRKMNPVNVENLKATLRLSGCSAQGVEEITASLLVLASYNLLNNLQATQPGTVSLEYLANILNGLHTPSLTSYGAYGTKEGDANLLGKPDQQQQQLLSFYNSLGTATANTTSTAGGFGSLACSGIESLSDLPDGGKELQVNESLVGSILGPGGRNIVDMQKFTSTSVQISKKGVFAPGTKNRLVTIRGSCASDIDKAVFMIQQYVLQEEAKRNRQEHHSISKY